MRPRNTHAALLTRRLALLVALGFALPASAGPGHEGGHDEAAPVTATGPSLPRFESHSDLFEVVGTLRNGVLSLTLDTYATNEPVAAASIEIESGAYKAIGEFEAESGTYRFKDSPFAQPGTHPVTLTITAGDNVDLLAADLVITALQDSAPPARSEITSKRLLWGAGTITLLLGVGLALRRALRRSPAAEAK